MARAAEHDGLGGVEATISRTVKYVNAENALRLKKFSVSEMWLSGSLPPEWLYSRSPGDPMPKQAPKFPHKPPANDPPRRKPLSKRTPKIGEIPESVGARPDQRL